MVGGLDKFEEYFAEYTEKQYEQSPVDMKSLKIRGVADQQIIDRLKQIYLQKQV